MPWLLAMTSSPHALRSDEIAGNARAGKAPSGSTWLGKGLEKKGRLPRKLKVMEEWKGEEEMGKMRATAPGGREAEGVCGKGGES